MCSQAISWSPLGTGSGRATSPPRHHPVKNSNTRPAITNTMNTAKPSDRHRIIDPPRTREALSTYHVKKRSEFRRLARPITVSQVRVPFRAVFGRPLASLFVAGRTSGTLILYRPKIRPLGGSAVLRTRYVITALLGVVFTAVAVGQEPRT